MKKCYIQNLAFIVTDKCNLDCAHCLRGNKYNNDISDDAIIKTLQQVSGVGNLAINGGEPTLAIEKIEKIISYVIENHISIDEFTVTINGTIYSEKLLELLEQINNYIEKDDINAFFAISIDDYHFDEIKRLGITKEFKENLAKYMESKYFLGFRNTDKKLFREGNPVNLDNKLTVPLRPLQTFLTYVDKDKKLNVEIGLCNIGPLVTINTNGIITESDASLEHQETIYNYGNVLTELIEDACIRNGAKVLRPKKFERASYRAIKKHQSYNR